MFGQSSQGLAHNCIYSFLSNNFVEGTKISLNYFEKLEEYLLFGNMKNFREGFTILHRNKIKLMAAQRNVSTIQIPRSNK